MNNQKETLEQFKLRYKQHHTCGYPTIPYDLSFSSDCPQCCPDSHQWEKQAELEFYSENTYYDISMWTKHPKFR